MVEYITMGVYIERHHTDGSVVSVFKKEAQIKAGDIPAWQKMFEDWSATWKT